MNRDQFSAIVYWVTGSFCFMAGALAMVTQPLVGALALVLSGLLLPPIRNFVHALTQRTLSLRNRVLLALILLALIGAVSGTP